MSTVKPNLLILAHRFPYPPNRGDRIRTFNLIKYLSRDYRIYLGTLWDEKPTSSDFKNLAHFCTGFAPFRIGPYARWVYSAFNFARGQTATTGLFTSRLLINQVLKWKTQVCFHHVIIISSGLSYIARYLHGVPITYDLVDVDSQKWNQYAKRSKLILKWLYRIEATRLRKIEHNISTWATNVTLAGTAEATLFRTLYDARNSYGIHNGVDLGFYTPSVEPIRKTTSCIFVGALNYRPNVDGLLWFCHHCWPHLRALHPSASLSVVGRNPTRKIRLLENLPGVKLFASVADVRPYIECSAISIAPLLIARGIQNKILESMAMGLPVIASPAASEGIKATQNEHLIVAETRREWTNSIDRLLRNPQFRERLGKSAREFVERNYSWEHCLNPLNRLIRPHSPMP